MSKQRANSTREAWVVCLILGMIMINFPFIHIFNNDRMLFDIPILVLYFFIGWPASIWVTRFFMKKIDQMEEENEDNSEGRGSS